MGAVGRLLRGESDIDFVRVWRATTAASALAVILSVGALVTGGLNLGIDFEGGVVWEVSAPGVSTEEARDALATVGESGAKIQTVGADVLRVQAGPQTDEESAAVVAVLVDLSGAEAGDVSISTVGPSWGQEITDAAVRALIWFFVVIAAYLTIRLEWRMAVGALSAVVHDIIVSVGVYALFDFEVTPSTLIAFLTILGYSLYDTIVVYDKVRENQARAGTREPSDRLMSRSLNETVMRSINTTITTLLPVGSMLVVGAGIMGAVVLKDFSVALFVGLLLGAYSSFFVAAPVVVLLHARDPQEKARRERAARVDGRAAERDRDVGAPADASPIAERPTVFSTGHPPRPRKQGKRR